MDRRLLPIVQEFYLLVDQESVLDNRIVPLQMNTRNRIEKAIFYEKSHTFYTIHALVWKDMILCRGIFIYHFQELVLAFLHNQLNPGQEHLILDKNLESGVKVFLDSKRNSKLQIQSYDSYSNSFSFSENLNKVECRIMIRMLNNYLRQGEIIENYLDGSVKCNYSGKNFYPKSKL